MTRQEQLSRAIDSWRSGSINTDQLREVIRTAGPRASSVDDPFIQSGLDRILADGLEDRLRELGVAVVRE